MRTDQHLTHYYEEIWQEAENVAHQQCLGSFSGTDTCEWYHAAWPVLRLLDMVSTPYWHRAFYEFAIAAATHVSGRIPRVCVFGAADFSMADLTVASLERVGISASVTVWDRCRTALKFNEDWAIRRGAALEAVQRDLLTGAVAPGQWDLGVSDALLTRFAQADRRRVLSQIALALRDGGYFITAVRDHSWTAVSSPLSSREFSEKAADLAAAASLDALAVKRLALVYATKMESFSAAGPTEICRELEGVGLEPIYLEHAIVRGELQPTAYARIIARKT